MLPAIEFLCFLTALSLMLVVFIRLKNSRAGDRAARAIVETPTDDADEILNRLSRAREDAVHAMSELDSTAERAKAKRSKLRRVVR